MKKAMTQSNPSPSRKRVVGYVRISSERQTNNESPATQRDAIQRYADANNMDVVAWFEDIAKSGKNADRAGIQSLLDYCLKHKGEDRPLGRLQHEASLSRPRYLLVRGTTGTQITRRHRTLRYGNKCSGHQRGSPHGEHARHACSVR